MNDRMPSHFQTVRWDFCEEFPVWLFATTLRSCEIRKTLNVDPLLPTNRSQLHWLGHVIRTSWEILARHIMLATLKRKWSRGRPSPRWPNYISDVAWSRLGAWASKGMAGEGLATPWIVKFSAKKGCFLVSSGKN